MRVRCRPQTDFPAEFHAAPQPNRFDTEWTVTRGVLERELEHLGATEVVIELAVTESDLRIDGWPYAGARPSHPGVAISFDSKHGPLRYGTDAFPNWQANARAIALGLESLRRVERYGIGKRGEQYVGWRALGSGDEMGTQEAHELLNRYGGVKAALRATHPDHGGDGEEFRRVQRARQVLGL